MNIDLSWNRFIIDMDQPGTVRVMLQCVNDLLEFLTQ